MKFFVLCTLSLLVNAQEDKKDCIICDILQNLNDDPMKLAPSKRDIDQLLLHHVLVKSEPEVSEIRARDCKLNCMKNRDKFFDEYPGFV